MCGVVSVWEVAGQETVGGRTRLLDDGADGGEGGKDGELANREGEVREGTEELAPQGTGGEAAPAVPATRGAGRVAVGRLRGVGRTIAIRQVLF